MERYLLFDSGCSLCTAMVRQVEDASDGKLMARSLRDPDVRSVLDEVKPGWRWEPMLLEVDGDRRRVYAGRKMQFRMLRLLGWRRSLDTLRVLYEHDVSSVTPSAGRRSFLRHTYGFALSVALLPILGKLPTPRQTSPIPQGNHPLQRVQFLEAQELTGQALQEALQTALQSPDVRNVLDSMLPNKVFLPAVAGGSGVAAQGETLAPNLANAKAVRHTLDGGNELLAVAWTVGENIVVYYQVAQPIRHYQTQAMWLTVNETAETIEMQGTSVNGRTRVLVDEATAIAAGIDCTCQRCISWDWDCLARYALGCGSCIAWCIESIGMACALCIWAVCPWIGNQCCDQTGC